MQSRPPASCCSKRKIRRGIGKPSRKRPQLRKLSDAVFAELETVLVELYKDYPLRLVRDIGICCYNVHDSLSTYQKRFSKRRRGKIGPQTRGPGNRLSTGHLLSPEDFAFFQLAPRIAPPWNPDNYRLQERILYNIDHYFDGTLGPKCRGNLLPSARAERTQDSFPQMETWDMLSDLCEGANLLVSSRGFGKAEALFDRFFAGLESAFSPQDPSFIAIFPHICLQLRGIESPWPKSNLLDKLLEKIKILVLARGESGEHPIFRIAASMSKVNTELREDLKDTLRIVFFKVIGTLLALVGDNSPIILHTLSLYLGRFQIEATETTRKINLPEKLFSIYECARISQNDNAINTALYNIVYTSAKACAWYAVSSHYALELFNRTKSLPFTDDWTPTARAYSFAAKSLALEHRHRAAEAAEALKKERERAAPDFTTILAIERHQYYEQDMARYYLEEAITKLGAAGSDHRIRAIKIVVTTWPVLQRMEFLR